MKIIKGKSYIFFGNFPNCDDVAEKLKEELGIEAKAFLSKTDSTTVVEYCEKDKELEEINKKYINLLRDNEKLLIDLKKSKINNNNLDKELEQLKIKCNDLLRDNKDYKKNWSPRLFK